MSEQTTIMPHQINAPMLGQHTLPAAMVLRLEDDLDYMTILAHDLRNYLTPVSAQLGMLYKQAQREQREPDMRAAARGRQALDQALSLISDLLEANRVERGLFELSAEPLNLSLLIQQVAEVFETNHSPIQLRMHESLIVCADHERLRQVLHNLIGNALTYSPRGMPVTIDVNIESHEYGQSGVVKIRNGGPAIPAHVLPQLFQRFAAGPGSRGLGLGLYLARGIAEAHGGTLTAHSDDSTGTCFVLALPLADLM